MTARFSWMPRARLRLIDEAARETVDPVERLRYVRSQMKSIELLEVLGRWPAGTIVVVIAGAIAAVFLVWQFR